MYLEAASSSLPLEKTALSPPNFILYLVDDQCRLDYGCYGNPKVYTPAVDRLAAEGIRFNKTYTAQAICAPARSMLYTGNFPVRNGCYLNHLPVREGQASLIPHFEALGYRVILAGKSHVGPDEAFPWTEHWDTVTAEDEDLRGGQAERLPLAKITSFIENEEGPYCLVLASPLPHSPYPEIDHVQEEDLHLTPRHPRTPQKLAQQAGCYENIRRDNAQLEAVLAAVDRSPQAENTLFLYTADHGQLGKFSVYEPGLNVPMVVRWPARVNSAGVSEAQIALTDILPTFLEAAGGQAPEGIDGRSFLSVLDRPSEPFRHYVYGISESQNIWIPKVFPMRMVSDGRWKYIRNANAWEVHEQNFGSSQAVNGFIRAGAEQTPEVPYEELYDLEKDPFEQTNLAGESDLAATQTRLAAELERWMQEQGDYLAEGGPLPLFEPRNFALDQANQLYSPPAGLEDSLTPSDYRAP